MEYPIKQDRKRTLQDIAREAKVSVASVSHALNGKGRLSPSTRRLLEQRLRDAGYRLFARRYPVLYICHQDQFEDVQAYKPIFDQHSGLSRFFVENGINLRFELLSVRNKSDLRDELIRMLEAQPAAVVVSTDLHGLASHVVAWFTENGVPVVQIGHTNNIQGIHSVVIDNFTAGRMAAEYLAKQGHKRIGIIRWWAKKDPVSAETFAGFCCGLQAAGIDLPDEYVVETAEHTSASGPLQGRDGMDQLLALEHPPTGVFVENSMVSPSLIYPCSCEDKEAWLKTQEVEMIHFESWHLDWLESALGQKLLFPQRATALIKIDWQMVGQVAAERTFAIIEGTEVHESTQIVRIAPTLVRAEGMEITPISLS
ncbi:LacI family DNA-binding transcriptional regulator [Poriferisphaera sp. WC338]|uniref:LacI family DNA-binding transcriptional regulator n=1 Tax=Poriferisphaera sp. WC338 TaxID=3425129 RepID=UPI003D815883